MEYASDAVTQWLLEFADGDQTALNRVIQVLYPELRRQARYQLQLTGGLPTLSTHVIVHEAYLKFVNTNGRTPTNRKHFVYAAAQAMRQVIVDYARQKQSAKREPEQTVESDVYENAAVDNREFDELMNDLIEVERLMSDLDNNDATLAEVIAYRYLIGLTEREIATAMDISYRTVQRKCQVARALLHEALA